eukprot:6522162-Alexandrium_andersonii.AAC.1
MPWGADSTLSSARLPWPAGARGPGASYPHAFGRWLKPGPTGALLPEECPLGERRDGSALGAAAPVGR